MCPIDVFAHVLLPDFYQAMLQIDATISDSLPFVQHPQLADMGARRQFWDGDYCSRSYQSRGVLRESASGAAVLAGQRGADGTCPAAS